MLNVIHNTIGSLQGSSDRGSAPVASSVDYTGTLLQGQILTGTYVYSDADGKAEGASTLNWYRADDTSGTNKVTISGANSATYTLGSDDVGKHIAYAVTPVDVNGYSGATSISAYQGAIASNDTAPVASLVTYSGTLTQGQLLNGTYTYSDADGDLEGASTYIWYRANDSSGTGQAAIAGATSQTYTLVAGDEAKFIAFQVIPVAANGYSGTAVRSAYQGMVNSTPVASSANYTGTLTEGQVLSGTYTFTNADGSADSGSTFIWYRADDASGTNQSAISGATAQTYTLVTADVAKHIAFQVMPISANGITGIADVSAYQGVIAAVPSFTGLLDTYSGAAVGYSLRKLRTAYSGNCVKVRRESDSTELDIGFVNNVLDTASLATFCSGTDGFVSVWYDQSGNSGNATKTSADDQPKIVSSGSVILDNGLPTVEFNGTTNYLDTPQTTFNDYSMYFVQSSNSLSGIRALAGQFTKYLYIKSGGATFKVKPGGDFAGYNEVINTQSLLSVNRASTSTIAHKNGTSFGSTYTSTTSLVIWFIGEVGGFWNWNGNISEIVMYPSDKSSDRTAIETEIKTNYGI